MITIRPETTVDHAAVHEVNVLAFGREVEAHLIEALRQSPDFTPELSLVAVENGQVVGHILFSPMTIEERGTSTPALALAVMAVRPKFQKRGIGSSLVRHGLKECWRLEHQIVIVVGHPEFYPRFGFSSARAKGLEAPFQVPDEAFMALELTAGSLDGISGMVRYPPAFDEAIEDETGER